MSASLDLSQNMLDRIRHDLVRLKMPRALEALDQIVRIHSVSTAPSEGLRRPERVLRVRLPVPG